MKIWDTILWRWSRITKTTITLAISLSPSCTPNPGASGTSYSGIIEMRGCVSGDESIFKWHTLRSSAHTRFHYSVPTLPLDVVWKYKGQKSLQLWLLGWEYSGAASRLDFPPCSVGRSQWRVVTQAQICSDWLTRGTVLGAWLFRLKCITGSRNEHTSVVKAV